MKSNPIVVLLTDFGVADQYVASMKGIILSLAPRAGIVDLSHGVARHNVSHAAFLLWSSYSWFPKKSIFVCVVDPGVGTARRILCVTAGGYKFIAPDNGLLKYILPSRNKHNIISITNKKYLLTNISRTFHGRDIFAPVAAHLFNGLDPRKLGSSVTPRHGREEFVHVKASAKGSYHGKILHIDQFGNAITNLSCRTMPENAVLRLGKASVRRSFNSYGSATNKMPFMIIGSSGLIELSTQRGSAARVLGARLDQPVTVYVR